jgi:hypothetical protein
MMGIWNDLSIAHSSIRVLPRKKAKQQERYNALRKQKQSLCKTSKEELQNLGENKIEYKDNKIFLRKISIQFPPVRQKIQNLIVYQNASRAQSARMIATAISI